MTVEDGNVTLSKNKGLGWHEEGGRLSEGSIVRSSPEVTTDLGKRLSLLYLYPEEGEAWIRPWGGGAKESGWG